MISSFNWVDLVILAIIALNALFGTIKGFVKGAVSLVTWILALVLSNAFYPDLAAKFASVGSPAVANSVSFILISVVVLLFGFIAGMILNRIVFLSMGLSVFNTLGGGLFGIIKGMVLVTVLVYIAMLTPAPKYAPWQASQLLPYFAGWADDISKIMPNSVTEDINKVKNINPNDLKNINIQDYTQKISNAVR